MSHMLLLTLILTLKPWNVAGRGYIRDARVVILSVLILVVSYNLGIWVAFNLVRRILMHSAVIVVLSDLGLLSWYAGVVPLMRNWLIKQFNTFLFLAVRQLRDATVVLIVCLWGCRLLILNGVLRSLIQVGRPFEIVNLDFGLESRLQVGILDEGLHIGINISLGLFTPNSCG